MFKSTVFLLTSVIVFLVITVFQPGNVLAKSPHKMIMEKLNTIQDTLYYDVVPYISGVGVPKTGQTLSYAPGDDGDYQKGVPWPNPRFTDNGDGTVTDNLTRFIWLKNANRFGTLLWADALYECNSLADDGTELTDCSVAGDWRLPNIRELHSLIAYAGYSIPPLPNTAGTGQWTEGDPFSNVQITEYWSSTSHCIRFAWGADFKNGDLSTGSTLVGGDKTRSLLHVWCVRGGR